MKKSNKRLISTVAIFGILLLVYVLLVTVIPFKKTGASWIAFSFGIVSILACCGISLFAFMKGKTFISKIYGFSIFKLGVIYLASQMATSLVLFVVGAFVKVPGWIALLINIILLAFCAIGLLVAENTRDAVEEIDDQYKEKTKTVKTFNIGVEYLVDIAQDPELRKKLEDLADEFKYSDPVSSEATEDLEDKIKVEIANLKDMIVEGADVSDITPKITQIKNLLSARNRICKNSK